MNEFMSVAVEIQQRVRGGETGGRGGGGRKDGGGQGVKEKRRTRGGDGGGVARTSRLKVKQKAEFTAFPPQV